MSSWIYIILAFFISALAAKIILPWLINLCYKKGLFDLPNERKVHKSNVPRMGGIVLVPCAIVGACVALASMSGHNIGEQTVKLSMQLIGGGVMLIYLVGVLDDMFELSAKLKFLVQLVSASSFIICNLYINNLDGLFGIYELPYEISVILTVLVIMVIMNAINLIDGIDGLASGLSMLALIGFCWCFNESGTYVISIACSAIMGGLATFMYYNLFGTTEKRNKTFMGDSGSLFLGIALSYFAIKYVREDQVFIHDETHHYLITSISLVFIPIFDLCRVALCRLKRGQHIFHPDKTHLHHKFMAKGFTMRQALLAILFIQCLICFVNGILTKYGVNINVIIAIDVIAFTILNIWLPVNIQEDLAIKLQEVSRQKRRLRILHISKYYPPYNGGIEDVCKNVVESIKEHDQMVFCFNDGPENVDEMMNGIRIFRVGIWKEICRQPISFQYHTMLRRLLNNYQPDIIHIHCPNPLACLSTLLLASKKTKIVVHWHSDIVVQHLIHIFFSPIENWLLYRADAIIATSPNYIEGSEYLSHHKHKCVVVPNTVIKEKLDSTYSEKRVNELKSQYGKFVFFVGRHVTYKGIEYLIETAKLLGQDVNVLIGGKGPLTSELVSQAAGLTNIHFLGRVPDEDLGNYMRACTVFAFPSITKNEAFGVVLAEAMYCGAVPVTFTINCSGVNWVSINGETGIQVANGNIKAYADAVRKLLDDNELRERYSTSAHERVMKMFMPECVTSTLINLYNSIV